MSAFLSDHGAIVAVVCAACAVAYGVVTTNSLLALSPGNETMRGLSNAVQEGAHILPHRIRFETGVRHDHDLPFPGLLPQSASASFQGRSIGDAVKPISNDFTSG